MDKMIQMGTRMQKAIASGDYESAYGDSHPDMAAPAAAAPAGGAGGSVISGPGGSAPAFQGTNEMTAPIAENLNRWAEGDLGFIEGKIPRARGATYK